MGVRSFFINGALHPFKYHGSALFLLFRSRSLFGLIPVGLKGVWFGAVLMNKGLVALVLLIVAGLGAAVVKRATDSSEKLVPVNYQTENLKDFQGEWYAAPTNGARSFTAQFKGHSLRLMSGTLWRITHTVVGLDERSEENLIVVDNEADALVYRFESEDVLWLEFQPDSQTARKAIRFKRVQPSD
jgi:hypothetical protein